MSSELEAIEKFGFVCLAVSNMMDEEGLAIKDALKAVRQMMQPHCKPRDVVDGIKRLETATTEAELFRLLSEEARRISRILEMSRLPWPTSLFS